MAASNAGELIALARAKPNEIFAASSGNGAFSHLLVEALKCRNGIRTTHVPFKCEAPAVQHLPSNQDAMICIGTPPLAIANVNAGKLKGLVVATAGRMEQLRDVASLAGRGVGDFNEGFWCDVVAPAATPANIVDACDHAASDIARAPALQQSPGRLGCDPLPLNAAKFGARIKADPTKYSAIAKAVGMKVD